jgi:bifunctional DNA primase/polymerase-like protein
METPMTARNVDAALKLARHGVPVFPCNADKVPLVKLGPGFKDATTDPNLIKEWWSKWPDALVSVRTGIKFVVLDIDCAKHVEAAQWYGKASLPITRTHITRSGGRHLLFRPDECFRNSASRICRGVDTKGVNGCAIWWPACGFEVLHGGELAPVPDWIIKALKPPPPIVPPSSREVKTPAQAQRKVDGIIRTIVEAREGERNAVAFWGAARLAEMVAQSLISSADAIAIATEAASRAGLPQQEARRTAQSALDNHFGGSR